MTTLLDPTRPDEHDRLDTLTELTRDTRVSLTDRLALRAGLWLLLRTERRTRDTTREARRALAREEFTRTQRETALVRAMVLMQYR
jgi:hypothetical protein